MKTSFAILILLAVAAGCSGRVERDNRPVFAIDRSRPWRLEFGRGSGWDGLETVKVHKAGRVVLHRMTSTQRGNATVQTWEQATIQLPPGVVAEVVDAVESNGLLGLHKAYHDDKIADGTQWVLWIEQGEREKTVYFNNHFPTPIRAFAEQLDAILARAGLDQVAWQTIPEEDSQQHAKELWDSIRS